MRSTAHLAFEFLRILDKKGTLSTAPGQNGDKKKGGRISWEVDGEYIRASERRLYRIGPPVMSASIALCDVRISFGCGLRAQPMQPSTVGLLQAAGSGCPCQQQLRLVKTIATLASQLRRFAAFPVCLSSPSASRTIDSDGPDFQTPGSRFFARGPRRLGTDSSRPPGTSLNR